jgi:hypothetical protein
MTTPQQIDLLAAVAEQGEVDVPLTLLEDLGRPALATDLRELADEGLVDYTDDTVRITDAGREAVGPRNSA